MEVVLPQPFTTRSIRQLSRQIKMSYALVYESVKKLNAKKMIKIEKIGNSVACKVNLSANTQLLAISSLEHSHKMLDNARFGFIIDELKQSLQELLYIMVLFGSYAKGTATSNSDVDLLFVVQNEQDIEKTKKKIKSVLSLTKIKIEFEVVTIEWLLKMFGEKHSVGREVLENSIILHGAEQYYTLVGAYDRTKGH